MSSKDPIKKERLRSFFYVGGMENKAKSLSSIWCEWKAKKMQIDSFVA